MELRPGLGAGCELKWSPGVCEAISWVGGPAETAQVNDSLQVLSRPWHAVCIKVMEERIPAKTVHFTLKDKGIETLSFLPGILNLRLGNFNEKYIPLLK